MFSVWGNWRAEGKVCFVKVSNTGCNDAKINRHNHAFLNRPFSTILFSHWQSTSNFPHVYGEYQGNVTVRSSYVESPPCVWGVLLSAQGVLSANGITPMCMGSTGYLVDSKYVSQNHPHVYGEYSTSVTPAFVVLESPPCVWGVLIAMWCFNTHYRITPMCMGSTATLCPFGIIIENHPHVYGEYSKNYLIYRHS